MTQNVIITRSIEENTYLEQQIKKLGFNPIPAPMLSHTKIDCDFTQFVGYTDIVITSKFAAQIIANYYLYDVRAWVVGSESAALLQKNIHITVEKTFDKVEELISALLIHKASKDNEEQKFIYFSGNFITQEIPSLYRYVLYNTEYASQLSSKILETIIKEKANFIMVYSINSAQNFIDLVKRYNHLQSLKNSVVIAISPEVGKVLKPYVQEVRWPLSPNSNEMIKLLQLN